MWDFTHNWITEQPIFVQGLLQREANNTETLLFTMSFAFVLHGNKAEERNMTSLLAHETNRCTFWSSCTGVSSKRHFLCIMRNFDYSWLLDMLILVGRVLHTRTESTQKMSCLGCFWISFRQGDRLNKARYTCAEETALHMFHEHLDILDNSNFCFTFLCIINLGTVRSLCSPSWFQVQCTQSSKLHRNHTIWRVFCFPDVYSYGSRVLHDLD